jgi:hypothetical protein
MADHKGSQTGHEIAALIITLIHGTWARGADWTQEHSFFQERLREKLRKPVTFRRFEWSGGNSHTQRLQAGKALGKYLRTEFEASPQATHVLIAHSHGGNIAHYALQDGQLLARLDGLVCLATPFLQVRPRHLPWSLFWPVGLYSAVTLLAVVGKLLYRSGLVTNATWSLDSRLFALLLIGVLPIVAVVLVLLTSLLKGTYERFDLREFLKTRPERSELLKFLRLPMLGTKKLFVVRPSADEASGVLTTSQFFAWSLSRIWSCLDAAFLRAERAFMWILYGLVVGVVIWFAAFMLLHRDIPFFGVAFAGASMFGGLVTELVGCVASFIVGLILCSQSPFGFDAMYMSFELETIAEASPPGEARVLQVSMPEHRLLNTKGLAHSRIYENEDVVDAIADWINNQRGH